MGAGVGMPTAPPWRPLLMSAIRENQHIREWSYFTLATVRRDGRPAARTVVYRGMLGDGDAVTFTTDSRSGKVRDIAHQPWGEASWYFAATRQQFRLAGPLRVVGATETDAALQQARISAWSAMSNPGRAQFFGPAPGTPCPCAGAGPAGPDPDPPTPAGDSVADTFCLVVLSPREVDVVDLVHNRRTRIVCCDNGEWETRSLHP